MPSRRAILSATPLAALGALTACSAEPAGAGSAPAGTAAAGTFPRTVEHELGRTELAERPQRVACATDGAELCSLLALGVRPVGFGQRNDPLRSWVRELARGVPSYPLAGETNFEQVALWSPDLLLVQRGFATDDNLATYSAVAPTVVTSFIDWRTNLQQVARAVGLEEEAARRIASAEAAVAARAAALPAAARGVTLRTVAAFDDGSLYVLNDRSPAGRAAAALGLPALPAQATPDEAVDPLSEERLEQLEGNLLVLLDFGAGRAATDALRAREGFQRLDVVRSGRVVELGEEESNQLYFDSVLTVEPNADLLARLATEAAG
ncbi:iron complex transport system substrate-binding protein [Kineococcus radiotolerans]|uniref:Iron complex transport system substrate-binding protein n=1 Tax=Kineococcus radiotolerans TaxID=131568 RepID=A0A7W4TN14_KINRA|nr:ABC transporter substrate-binding protein [Kineococcus radiotolerans]MBB2901810.1 iron complex transport system substrate-binding protein [Kineococcus radiotolerans]